MRFRHLTKTQSASYELISKIQFVKQTRNLIFHRGGESSAPHLLPILRFAVVTTASTWIENSYGTDNSCKIRAIKCFRGVNLLKFYIVSGTIRRLTNDYDNDHDSDFLERTQDSTIQHCRTSGPQLAYPGELHDYAGFFRNTRICDDFSVLQDLGAKGEAVVTTANPFATKILRHNEVTRRAPRLFGQWDN